LRPGGFTGHNFMVVNWSSQMNKFARVIVPASVALAVMSSANAAVDVTAATAGIADAQTAVLAVLATMITMAAAIFGVRKVLRLIRG
jgi:hypothetical protein